jgi:hypothetical protein
MSKHAMHANCAKEVYYSGEFYIFIKLLPNTVFSFSFPLSSLPLSLSPLPPSLLPPLQILCQSTLRTQIKEGYYLGKFCIPSPSPFPRPSPLLSLSLPLLILSSFFFSLLPLLSLYVKARYAHKLRQGSALLR